mmetsp:Transcript_2309/g.6742  ORF Transcript_2309/g.6742 Transcript_2309/m.6742 type:complete len:89 (+) Transcript_2309:1256-1522(+)
MSGADDSEGSKLFTAEAGGSAGRPGAPVPAEELRSAYAADTLGTAWMRLASASRRRHRALKSERTFLRDDGADVRDAVARGRAAPRAV